MTTLAFFGGSFNPPHLAHQMVCLYVLETAEIDRVIMAPTYRHVFGKELASFDDRLQMCELVARCFGNRVEVSAIERELGRPVSRTLDTLEELGRRHPGADLRLVVGSDILAETGAWHRWDLITQIAPPLVVPRAGYPSGDAPGFQLPEVSSTEIRERIGRGESALPLVPRSVMDYIAERGLYR